MSSENSMPPASGPELMELSKMLYDHIEGQIARADIKAELILAADAILGSTIIGLGRGAAARVADIGAPYGTRLIGLYSLCLVAALFVSLCYALLVILPDLTKPIAKTLIYFDPIAAVPEESSFVREFKEQSAAVLLNSLLSEVYAKSKIAARKFSSVRRSIVFLFASLVLWGLIELVVLLTTT